MRTILSGFFIAVLALPGIVPATSAAAQTDLMANAKSATVFVAKYNAAGKFIGWGSGFYVDEGVVVTNKHVVDGGQYFKIFPAESDDTVNLDCGKELGLSDVKINLDDDAAYMRAYMDPGCTHGVLQFAADDPPQGEALTVLGYPAQSTVKESLHLVATTGTVTGKSSDGWLTTDAYLHFGNSGGPVISKGRVIGVAVAKSIDESGNYTGYFVPQSIILRGLLYANNSTFGYTPQEQQNNPAYPKPLPYGKEGDPFDPPRENPVVSDGECRASLGEGAESTGYRGCRCKDNYHKNVVGNACLLGPAPAPQSSSASSGSSDVGSSSSSPAPRSPPEADEVGSSSSVQSSSRLPLQTPFQQRTCARVKKSYSQSAKILERVNTRLKKRFGWGCGTGKSI